jgi:hypothetical protein
MSPVIILAIGVGVATALVTALLAARQAGGAVGSEEHYGNELDAPQGMRRRRAVRPDARQRAMVAVVAGAAAAIAAAAAAMLGHGPH